MSNWTVAWVEDVAERAGTAAVSGVLAMVTADSTGVVSGSPKQWWLIVGLPTAVSVLKALLLNLRNTSGEPTASFANVSSTKVDPPVAVAPAPPTTPPVATS